LTEVVKKNSEKTRYVRTKSFKSSNLAPIELAYIRRPASDW